MLPRWPLRPLCIGWVLALVAHLGLLLTLSGLAYLRLVPRVIRTVPASDTIAHFGQFGLAAFLAHRALGRSHGRLLGLLVPIGPLAVGTYAVGDELFQYIVPTRTFSLLELAASLAGVVDLSWLASRRPVSAETLSDGDATQ